jgi:CRISPR/Cas system CSM-associated protein Csm3 (group 7 of RAMP superfamily)
MHKLLFNEAVIGLSISPLGPILIKSGEDGADPTKPDMRFVRSNRDGKETVYLPGSSLKGVFRSHCERLARTVQGNANLSCDPLRKPCGNGLEKKELSGPVKHAKSCFLCRLFGNTAVSSHFRVADAYPAGGEPRREERNGVAIDRIFGSVAVGPFNYETVTSGRFETTLYIKNFSIAQLGLIALTLRDLSAGRIRLGFGKSRGLGAVAARVDDLTLRYPFIELDGGFLRIPGGEKRVESSRLYGVGAFAAEAKSYGYPSSDHAMMPDGYSYVPDGWLGVEVKSPKHENGPAQWESLGRVCVSKWKEETVGGK